MTWTSRVITSVYSGGEHMTWTLPPCIDDKNIDLLASIVECGVPRSQNVHQLDSKPAGEERGNVWAIEATHIYIHVHTCMNI